MLIAFNLSLHHSKGNLLTAYLNQVEFLNGIRGYKSACEVYFSKPCSALFPSEMSFLIATAQTGKNPHNSKDFFTIKKKAEILCHRAFDSESCTNRDELPPSLDDINLQHNSYAKQFTNYYQAQNNLNQNSDFELSLYENINHLINSSQNYRLQVGM